MCLGFPGALPVLNARAVELAVKAALALGCEIQPTSIFARKNYFYPDLPKGYQISQYERPFALAGRVRWQFDGEAHDVRITRVHMEEDAGKSLHDTPEAATGTCLDFNRAGTPLVEIVTEPDIRSGAVAADFFSRLRDVLTTVGANDGNLEEGSLRCDANVSVRPAGTTTLGTKVEIKNLNSFRFVQKAIEYEIARQSAVVRDGGRIVQETRLWDADAGCTESMRSKEEAHDYRYFPEPDLPPLRIADADLARWKAELPELPEAMRERLVAQYGLPAYDAGVLTQSAALARFFEQTAAAAANPKAASNWIMGELLRLLRASDGDVAALTTVTPAALGALIRLVDAGTINGSTAKTVFETMFAIRPRARRDRHDRGPGAGERRRRGARHRARGDRPRDRCRRAIPQGQAGGDRLPHRPGDEGGQGQGQPEARRQPAGARARAAGRRRHADALGLRRLLPLAWYVLLAVAFTWPLARDPFGQLAALHGPGDPYLNLWILGWDLETISARAGGCRDRPGVRRADLPPGAADADVLRSLPRRRRPGLAVLRADGERRVRLQHGAGAVAPRVGARDARLRARGDRLDAGPRWSAARSGASGPTTSRISATCSCRRPTRCRSSPWRCTGSSRGPRGAARWRSARRARSRRRRRSTTASSARSARR